MIAGARRWLDAAAPAAVTAMGVALVALLGALDHLTGYEISFSVFYLAPIALVTWYARRSHGYALAVISAVVWLTVDLTAGSAYSHWLIPAWNATVRLAFFVITATLLGQLKLRLRIEAALARTDELTQVMNARAAREVISRLLQLGRRHRHPSALGFVDLDNFKAVNDSRGHAEGDRLLQTVAAALRGHVRESDVVGRLGGDEFVVFLPETGLAAARETFAKLHHKLIQCTRAWPVGFSIGVAVFDQAPDGIDPAFRQADALMYRAKRGGKNRIVCELGDVNPSTETPPPAAR